MPKTKWIWVLSGFVVCALVLGWRIGHPPGLLLAGKSPYYWLEHLPADPMFMDGSLKADHPLAKAGPELIPYLINAIEREYPVSRKDRFYSEVRRRAPAFIQRLLPPPRAPEAAIRCVAGVRLGLFGPWV